MNKLVRTIGFFSGLFIAFNTYAIEWDYGGYLSVYAGKVIDGDKLSYTPDHNGGIYGGTVYECPCFIADYVNAGVYEYDGWDMSPDSRAGVKVKASFTDSLSFSVQADIHGADSSNPEIDWAYLRYLITDQIFVDIGRKALPLFFYSDFVNVGYAYPWVRVPGNIYGWPIKNYNGISGQYTVDVGDGALSVNLWFGEEKDEENRSYEELYFGVPISIDWEQMKGASLEYSYDWLTLRTVYMHNKISLAADYGVGGVVVISDNVSQDFLGLAFNVDYEGLQLRSEINAFETFEFKSQAEFISLGYQVLNVTPTLSYLHYKDEYASFSVTETMNYSFTIRWDVFDSTALKIQFDKFFDKTDRKFVGDSEIVVLGVDYVFQ